MPEFVLDTSGSVETGYKPELPGMHGVTLWRDLDAFTQGYIEALFFTESGDPEDGKELGEDLGFSDLAPETLASIIEDCRRFLATPFAGVPFEAELEHLFEGTDDAAPTRPNGAFLTMESAGRDFWYTRNHHGVGFWDGDWPEPHATALDDAAKAFGEVDACLGDDGKVYLS